MKGYVILFAVLLIVCVYALINPSDRECPEALFSMAKTGVVLSFVGLVYSLQMALTK